MTEAPQQPYSKRKVCRMWLKPHGHWNVDMAVGDDFSLPAFILHTRGQQMFVSSDTTAAIPFENILFFAVLEVELPNGGQVVRFQTVKGGLADLKPEGAA